ncbi:MAG: hypothetical protein ABH837_00990 [bacterium]
MTLFKEILAFLAMILLVIIGESWMIALVAFFGWLIAILILTLILVGLTWLVTKGIFKPKRGQLFKWAELNSKASFFVACLVNILAGPFITVAVFQRLFGIRFNFFQYFLLSVQFSLIWITFYGGVWNAIYRTIM